MATILVVEDNRVLADTMAELLVTLGHAVRVAYDGAQAITEVAQSMPDAVVLDLGLPSVDGLEVARQLRQRYGRRLRLVAQTARADEETPREAAEAGFDDLLTKPCSIYRLVNAINLGSGRVER
jgi:CheY-like chemotaxis protein